jgi:hypothetical protein
VAMQNSLSCHHNSVFVVIGKMRAMYSLSLILPDVRSNEEGAIRISSYNGSLSIYSYLE